MPLDAICLSALTAELEARILDGRIDKVQQPERDMLILTIRAGGENLRLLLAAGSGNARVHLTRLSFENPAEPPMFCMLMRKHLVGSRIVSLRQPEGERMLILELDCRDELGLSSRKRMVAELIGRSANLILVGEDGRIIDCMRRVDYAGDPLRRLLPGMLYRMPPKQNKPDFRRLSQTERCERIAASSKEMPVDKYLLDSFSGLSPLICRELAWRCRGDYDALPAQLAAFSDSVEAGEFAPYLLVQDGKPLDFSFMAISQYEGRASLERLDSFSVLLDTFYARRDLAEQQRRRSHELLRSVTTARDRLARKLGNQKEELRRTENREEIRKNAELITANLYRIQKGDSLLVCEDYYEPDCREVKIPLNPLKTPQQNAALLYKEYNKMKTAEKHLTVLIAEAEGQLSYLNSVLDLIRRAETEKDLGDIRRELMETGYLRRQKSGKAEKGRAQQPYRFQSDDGLEILAGRSNLQNDELTLKTARRTDYWLHTQKVHGSHVIIRCDGLAPPERTLCQAASIAAYYSQARDGGKVPVDYTMTRCVKKPAGALPGMVIYTDYKTLIAESDEELVKRLKK